MRATDRLADEGRITRITPAGFALRHALVVLGLQLCRQDEVDGAAVGVALDVPVHLIEVIDGPRIRGLSLSHFCRVQLPLALMTH